MYIYTTCCPVDEVRQFQILYFLLIFLNKVEVPSSKTYFGALTLLIVTVIRIERCHFRYIVAL